MPQRGFGLLVFAVQNFLNYLTHYLLVVHAKETLLVVSTLLLAWQTILYRGLGRSDHGMAVTCALALFFELMKLGISVGLLLFSEVIPSMQEGKSFPAALLQVFPPPLSMLRETGLFMVPAAVYLINENLLFEILAQVSDPMTFEILGNLRVLTTSWLVTLVFGRELNRIQWSALVLLMLGTATSQVVTCGSTVISAISLQTFVFVLIYCTLSAVAGVFTEYMMKRRFHESIHVQNIQLHSCGVLLSWAALWLFFSPQLATDGLGNLALRDPTHVWLVLVHSVAGLFIAALIKHSDNIARIFAHSLSMLVAMVFFSVFYAVVPSVQLLFGVSIVCVSLFLFYTED